MHRLLSKSELSKELWALCVCAQDSCQKFVMRPSRRALWHPIAVGFFPPSLAEERRCVLCWGYQKTLPGSSIYFWVGIAKKIELINKLVWPPKLFHSLFPPRNHFATIQADLARDTGVGEEGTEGIRMQRSRIGKKKLFTRCCKDIMGLCKSVSETQA